MFTEVFGGLGVDGKLIMIGGEVVRKVGRSLTSVASRQLRTIIGPTGVLPPSKLSLRAANLRADPSIEEG